MSIKWEDVHFGISPLTNSIYMGKSKPMKGNEKISIWTDKSNDVTNECMYMVCRVLKEQQEAKTDGKPYAGYKYADGSQLVWIAPNHEIEIK